MRSIGLEDGGHVDHIHAHLLQVGQVLDDAAEITTQILLRANRSLIPELGVYRLARSIAAGENLIYNSVLCPVRDGKGLLLAREDGAVEHSLHVHGL